jgi:uncharacterized membrane protein
MTTVPLDTAPGEGPAGPAARGFLRATGAVLAVLLSVVVALVSYRYVLGVGPVPDVIAENLLKAPWLAIHVAGAATALLVGPFQFLARLRARYRALHRWMGRIYVVSILVGGVAGLVLAFGASTGPVSMAGFGILAVLWIAATALAWRQAMRRDFAGHRAWMIRSFALTFAAVTLRLYLPVLALLPVSFADGYRAISFLCWVPNLVLAELYLRRAR